MARWCDDRMIGVSRWCSGWYRFTVLLHVFECRNLGGTFVRCTECTGGNIYLYIPVFIYMYISISDKDIYIYVYIFVPEVSMR